MLKKILMWQEQNKVLGKLPDRKSNRLKDYDYFKTGGYFVTLCVEYGEHKFGEIADSVMSLNEAGKIVNDQLTELQNFYTTVSLDCFVVMPNHVHAIVVLNELGLQTRKSLPEVVKALKSISAIKIRSKGIQFNWQRSYYDIIITKAYAMEKIRHYICNNPMNWGLDAENVKSRIDKKKYYEEIAESIKEK